MSIPITKKPDLIDHVLIVKLAKVRDNYYEEPTCPSDIFHVVILGTIVCTVGLAILEHQ